MRINPKAQTQNTEKKNISHFICHHYLLFCFAFFSLTALYMDCFILCYGLWYLFYHHSIINKLNFFGTWKYSYLTPVNCHDSTISFPKLILFIYIFLYSKRKGPAYNWVFSHFASYKKKEERCFVFIWEYCFHDKGG